MPLVIIVSITTQGGILAKLGVFRSIGHNIADSLSCGMGFPIGVYTTDIYSEAERNAEGCLWVDFLNGIVANGAVSFSLAHAVGLYRNALDQLCEGQGIDVKEFKSLKVKYYSCGQNPRFLVEVEDAKGRKASDEYSGYPGKLVKELNGLGGIRALRSA